MKDTKMSGNLLYSFGNAPTVCDSLLKSSRSHNCTKLLANPDYLFPLFIKISAGFPLSFSHHPNPKRNKGTVWSIPLRSRWTLIYQSEAQILLHILPLHRILLLQWFVPAWVFMVCMSNPHPLQILLPHLLRWCHPWLLLRRIPRCRLDCSARFWGCWWWNSSFFTWKGQPWVCFSSWCFPPCFGFSYPMDWMPDHYHWRKTDPFPHLRHPRHRGLYPVTFPLNPHSYLLHQSS